ncbi:hypothetical protein CDAR_291221 [Caerostris darwini]|uniref:Uncharacterized protein n=1 Tax=Caerostris darwini TaxID=1538125 RepID=A0AAV4RK56_9ARAC|nr:hypothetical protein CDAR_291221 [Caerostris darwini]
MQFELTALAKACFSEYSVSMLQIGSLVRKGDRRIKTLWISLLLSKDNSMNGVQMTCQLEKYGFVGFL